MNPLIDIFKDYCQIISHKNAIISKDDDNIKICYNGPLVSSGFKFLLNSKPNIEYRLTTRAHLTKGDIAFIYCENRTKRLVERTFFITDIDNEYSLNFTATDKETYVGILFYNCNQEYEMYVESFQVCPVIKDTEIMSDLKSKITVMRQQEREIDSIANKNNIILNKIRYQSIYNYDNDTDCDTL